MRRALWIGGAAVVLLAAVVVAAILLVDVNRFREPIQSQLEKGLQRRVTLGHIGLRLIPLAVTVSDFSIGEAESFATGRPFAAAKQVRVRLGLLSLLRKQINVESLLLEQPSIELVRDRQGRWNYSTLGAGGAPGGEGKSGGSFALRRMQIEDGRIAVTDLAKRDSRSVYDHLDVDLTDFGPQSVFRLAASARLPGSSKDALKIEGKGGPLGSGAAPFTGRIELDNASLAGLMRFINSSQPLDGVLSGTADIDSTGAVMKASGGLELNDLRIRKAAVGYPVRVVYQLTANPESGLVKAPRIDVKVGDVPISLSAEVDSKASLMKGGLKVARASLAEVLALARALGAAGMSGSGVVSLDARIEGPYQKPEALTYSGSGALENAILHISSLNKPLEVRTAHLAFDKSSATLENVVASLAGSTLRGRMTARNAAVPDITFGFNIDKLDIDALQQAIGGGGAKAEGGAAPPRLNAKGTVDVGSILVSGVTLNRVHSDVALTNNVLTMAPLTAEIFGGKETGGITLDMRSQPAKATLNTKLSGVDAQKLLAATTSLQTLSGLLAAGVDANLSLAPGAGMAKTLNGSLTLQLGNGRLAGVNVLNQLAGLAKSLGYRQNPQVYTDIVQLAGDLKVTNGVATTDNLRLQIDGGALSGAGAINLVTQALDLRITAVLDREMSDKVGGSKVGGFLTTALANSKGELVIPALVTGTFAQPRFMPDAARVAEMKLKSLLPTSGGGGSVAGALQGILKPPSEAKPAEAKPGEAKPAETKPGGAVRGLIDALRRRGERSEPKQP